MCNLAIRKCKSPPLLANENLLPRRGLNPEPAEPEADMLPSEPARRASKHNNVNLILQIILIFTYCLKTVIQLVGIFFGLLYM